jgi:hypothetical protein
VIVFDLSGCRWPEFREQRGDAAAVCCFDRVENIATKKIRSLDRTDLLGPFVIQQLLALWPPAFQYRIHETLFPIPGEMQTRRPHVVVQPGLHPARVSWRKPFLDLLTSPS